MNHGPLPRAQCPMCGKTIVVRKDGKLKDHRTRGPYGPPYAPYCGGGGRSDTHPERHCGRCGGPNIVWCAPSPLWNAVMRGGTINGIEEYSIVCPTCFAVLAEERGIAQTWVLRAQDVLVELETVTPSGRVWDDDKLLWMDQEDFQ